ncbi:MAG: sulfite exporter TauE/SafE family protein [Candidatus Staskawiczbacteria bacterium]|nr:sulfite exporter TauE/SafE family protein [Candidatus Staskawiczbacteria bacterium]
MKEHTYYIEGMHCASCEIIVEKKLLELTGVKSVNASISNGRAIIEYEGQLPDINKLNNIFKKDNYTFFNKPYDKNTTSKSINKTLVAFNIAMGIIIVFLLLNNLGISKLLNVSSTSSLFAFFGLGLLAGISSCAALVGGIVLSMSKQWQELYSKEHTTYQKLQPHFLFNSGRILSYSVLGGLLGFAGSRLQLSFQFTAFLIIVVSLLMIALGLQMLEVKAFRKFQFSLPKFITRYIANENNFKGRYTPFLMGAATFFLPCGFTVSAQTLALLSGSFLQGALMLGLFALGTSPMLLLIGLSSVKFFEKPNVAITFTKVAGFLLLFFALFNINSQIIVFGFNDVSSVFSSNKQSVSINENGLAPIIDGKQVIKMTVYATNYSPNYFKVKKGIPVRWEVTSSGQPSCDSGAIVANRLFNDVFYLNSNAGSLTVKEFTPQNSGKYRFSCTMGMVVGTIEVVN